VGRRPRAPGFRGGRRAACPGIRVDPCHLPGSAAGTGPPRGPRLPAACREPCPSTCLAAGLRLGGPALALPAPSPLRRSGVLQLDADVVVRDRVAIADVEPPPRREVLVQPPEADRERDRFTMIW
jgi:hypothetical protein